MDQRLSFITLGVSSLERSRAFYERLGWRAHTSGGGKIVFFQMLGFVFALYPIGDLAADANQPLSQDNSGFRGFALAHNVASKAAVDATLAAAAKMGARILKPAHEAFWGGYSGYFADPDGFAWEVAYNPKMPLSPDGSLTIPGA